MLVSAIIKYDWLIFFCLLHSFFLKKRYIPAVIINLCILWLLYKENNPTLCIELSAILSILCEIAHNKKLKLLNVLYISIVSTGLMMLAIQNLDSSYIFRMINRAKLTKLNMHVKIASEIVMLISVVMMCGFVPFSERMIRLFSISRPTIKIITFITPMYISLLIFNNLINTFSNYSFVILGTAISLYSAICLAFCKNLKTIFSQIIIYFYGLQILFLAQTRTLQYLPLWFITITTTLVSFTLYTPNRALKYYISEIKQYISVNKCYFYTFVIIIITFILNFINNFLLFKPETKYLNIAVFVLPFWLFGVFIKSMLNQKTKIKSSNIHSINMQIMISIPIITVLMILSFLKIYKSSIHLTFSKALTYICIFSISLISSFVFKNVDQPNILTTKMYSHFFTKIISAMKVAYSINKTIVMDFFKTFNLQTVSSTSLGIAEKISNMLYGNYIYFYIIFLAMALIILMVECVVL